MTFKHAAILLLAAVALTACKSGSQTDGVSITIGETHGEAAPATSTKSTPLLMPAVSLKHAGEEHSVEGDTSAAPTESEHAHAAGGFNHDLDHIHITDKNGNVLRIYRLYMVLGGVQLVPCTSLADKALQLLNPLSTALAHSGHAHEAIGGRALDRPNVIDLVSQAHSTLPLGSQVIQAGRYCQLRLSLLRLAGEAYGKPTPEAAKNAADPGMPDLAGHALVMVADYCSQKDATGECTQRSKLRLNEDDLGMALPLTLTLPLDEPLELNSAQREAFALFSIHYGDWLKDVDISTLNSSPEAQQALLTAITDPASIAVFDAGAGELCSTQLKHGDEDHEGGCHHETEAEHEHEHADESADDCATVVKHGGEDHGEDSGCHEEEEGDHEHEGDEHSDGGCTTVKHGGEDHGDDSGCHEEEEGNHEHEGDEHSDGGCTTVKHGGEDHNTDAGCPPAEEEHTQTPAEGCETVIKHAGHDHGETGCTTVPVPSATE